MNIKTLYDCTQQQLYIACRMAWENYIDKLINFKTFKGKYTQQTALDAATLLQTAKDIDDEQTRNSKHESTRLSLIEKGAVCLALWQSLKSYIEEIWKKPFTKPQLEAAGSPFYEQAANKGWEQMQSLLDASNKFITTNTADLSNGGLNMPNSFPGDYAAATTAWQNLYTQFTNQEKDSKTGTNDKIIANNNLYTFTIDMLTDGQVIFANDPVTLPNFVFNTLVSYITTAGSTGLRLTLIEAITELPIANTTALLQPGNFSIKTNDKGIAENEMPEDDYSIEINNPLYNTYINPLIKIRTGVMHRLNVTLTKK